MSPIINFIFNISNYIIMYYVLRFWQNNYHPMYTHNNNSKFIRIYLTNNNSRFFKIIPTTDNNKIAVSCIKNWLRSQNTLSTLKKTLHIWKLMHLYSYS